MSHESRNTSRRDLTAESLDRLLERLSSEPDQAAERYNRHRARLIQYFAWQKAEDPEALTDEVINRVARRLTEGEEIPSLAGYFLGVARRVALEARERQAREDRALEAYARQLRQRDDDAADRETALACLDGCLDRLSAARREQLLAYYTGSQESRIQNRRRQAESLGIGPIALRNRMLRARQQLETCLAECLQRRSERDESSDGDTYSRRRRARPAPGDEGP